MIGSVSVVPPSLTLDYQARPLNPELLQKRATPINRDLVGAAAEPVNKQLVESASNISPINPGMVPDISKTNAGSMPAAHELTGQLVDVMV